MNQGQHYSTIRARLVNPPVKLTREALQERDDKIASLKRTIRVHEQMQDQKQAMIHRLEAQLAEAAKAQDALREQILEAESRIPKPNELDAYDAVISKELTRWQGVTIRQVKAGGRIEHIVRARHACVRALAEQIPGITQSEIGRALGMTHSSVRYVLKYKPAKARDAR